MTKTNSRRREHSDSLNELFDAEILRAEILRTTLLFFLALMAVVFFNVVGFFAPQVVRQQLGENFPIGTLQIFFVVACLYELLARTIFAFAKKRGIRIPLFGRMINAIIETALPGLPILAIGLSVGPLQGLNSPAILVYPFFILLSILRLDLRLSVLTGLVASIQYASVSLYLLPSVEVSEAWRALTSPPVYLSRAGLYLLLGLAAAFVASQLRARILSAFESMQERDQIVGVFGRHVSPEVANRLLADASESGEKRAVSVLFLDIRGFTTFSESRTPEEVFHFLNGLFAFMIEIIHKHNGIINKFLGDGFMAVFGAPIDSALHARDSFRAATEILSELERKIGQQEFPAIKIGIGIHSGEAMTGNVGSDRRMEYTIIGDVVNVASRLEQLNKESDTRLLLSEHVYGQLEPNDRSNVARFGTLPVRGRAEGIVAYRLV